MKIPYFDLNAQTRSIRPELDAALARTLDSGSFCLGPEVVKFERDFAAFVGTSHCIGLNSGTSALHIAMRVLGIGAGDEVITTPFTFIATSWAIAYVGAKPVFVDIDERTMNLDPGLLERAITPRTRAVLPVHLYGHPFDVDPILEICRRRGVPLVEDAAQAVGARYKGKQVGTFGSLSAFSFYPTKNLGACGEAGALVTDDAGIQANTPRGCGSMELRCTHHEEVGYTYRMEGFQGAVLNVKLPHLAAWTQARRRIAHRYHDLLAQTPLRLPHELPDCESVFHLYTVRHPARDRLRDHLQASEVGSALHYPLPLHLQACFKDLGYKPGAFPVAEKAARECLSLPMYPQIPDSQVEQVGAVVAAFKDW